MTDSVALETKRVGPLVPILASIIWPIIGVIGFVPAALTIMVFDGGTDNVPIALWFFFYGAWAFVASCVLTVPIAWTVWAVTKNGAVHGRVWRVLAALLPIIPLGVSAAALLFIAYGPCQGSFQNC